MGKRIVLRPIIDGIVGARPNMMKMAPLARAIADANCFQLRIIHTGQHYDVIMSRIFFDELGLPAPYVNLEAGFGLSDQEAQTANIIARYARFLEETDKPRGIIVVGDVNSTLACSIVAAKQLIPIAHVEAGLRSFDRTMPEEVNRIVCDALSEILFVSEPSGLVNLTKEGHSSDQIHFVGNIMIDNLKAALPEAESSNVLDRFKLQCGEYTFLTLHRPSNVDDPAILTNLLNMFDELSRESTIVFAAHPRTRERMKGLKLALSSPNLIVTEPFGYVDTLRLMRDARAVLTDSGGMQEECSVLNVPCLTLRNNTERPITTVLGSCELVGHDPKTIRTAWRKVAAGKWRQATEIPLWDGRTAQRIVEVLRNLWS